MKEKTPLITRRKFIPLSIGGLVLALYLAKRALENGTSVETNFVTLQSLTEDFYQNVTPQDYKKEMHIYVREVIGLLNSGIGIPSNSEFEMDASYMSLNEARQEFDYGDFRIKIDQNGVINVYSSRSQADMSLKDLRELFDREVISANNITSVGITINEGVKSSYWYVGNNGYGSGFSKSFLQN